jgi:hypothetical protein
VLRIRDAYAIPDPGSRIRIFPSRIPDKDHKDAGFLTPKTVPKLSEKLSGMFTPGSEIRIFFPSGIPDPGIKTALDPGSGSATLLVGQRKSVLKVLSYITYWTIPFADISSLVQAVRCSLTLTFSGR